MPVDLDRLCMYVNFDKVQITIKWIQLLAAQ